MSVHEVLTDRIARNGPLPVSDVLEVALYHPVHGFYEAGGVAGRREGDFLTSPEVGALFGAVVARALDGWWEKRGRPDPYVVVEAGAGPGTLARMVLAASPACAPALRYVLVDRAARQRARHREHLSLEDPSLVLPPVDPDSGQVVVGAGRGPVCTSLAEMPRVPEVTAVILANELLDNLPCDLAEHRSGEWSEIRVAHPEPGGEILVPLDEPRAEMLRRLVPDPSEGARAPLQGAAAAWLRDALATAGTGGRVAVVDYATRTEDLADRPQESWLRTYRRQAPGGSYLEDLGTQDVTCEVAVDQLATVRPAASDRTQEEWLDAWGIHRLVAEADEIWAERAHLGDLQAMKARSRRNEARALLDPGGLGGFRVVEWTVGSG